MEERRCELKRYGELFTYMSSRAIHLEVSYSMTLNCFISAYRRFVGCRGPFRQIQSDQGTNILGAKNELQLALSELDHDKIKQEPLKRNSDWVHCKTNAPKVCHMGGSWRNCAKRVCETWNHMSFSRLLVPFTVKTSLTKKDGSTFSFLQMNFGWGGRLSSCSCCRVDRNRSNRWQIWKMVTFSSWRTNPLHETIGSWPASVKPIQVTMTYLERLKSQS